MTVGAGGAVIALSDIDSEYEEMLLKATSVLGALGHRQSPGRLGPPGSEPLPRESPVNGKGRDCDDATGDGRKARGNVARNGDPRSGVRPLGSAIGEQRGIGVLPSQIALRQAGQDEGNSTSPELHNVGKGDRDE